MLVSIGLHWLVWLLLAVTLGFMLLSGWLAPH
jgi:cytochrome b561